ncbi:MAG TPA: methyl-accepting chemotaxis protein [Nitrospirae bacterium]|nr:methyl-accepting chemotaxis protein [Nitrospirota bacterium]
MKIKKKLSTTFIFRVLIILLIGQSFIWYWSFSRHNITIEDDLRERISLVSTLIANAAAAINTSQDYTYIEQLTEGAIKDKNIVSIEVTKGSKSLIRKSQAPEEMASQKMETPIMEGDKKTGTVTITYKQVKPDTVFILTNLILQGIVFLVLTFLIYLFFQRHIGRQIESLSASIEKVTLGDLTQKIEIAEDNEIGIIAKGLDFLIERLLITVRKLKSITGNVSAAISQLNLTFKNVINGISNRQRSLEEISRAVKNASGSQKQTIANTEKLLSLSNDNVSALLEMRAASEEIASSIGNLNSNISDSYSAVAGLTQSAQKVASMADNATSAVHKASTSIEEINASVKEAEKTIKESAELSNRTTNIIAEKGMLSVVDAMEGMERIEDSVNSLTEAIERLGRRSRDIEKILSVIKDVTEQTGMLSLNAQILAVQAGEHGKSFSIVADEMRNLSEKTAASTQDIATIVSTLQKEIREAMDSTMETVRMVEEGNHVVLKTGDALREILHASQKSTQMAASIEHAAAQQAKGLSLIFNAVDDIQNMILDVNRTTGQQERDTASLLESISSIKESMEAARNATDKQAESTGFITDNIELSNGKTAEIARASTEQQKVNRQIIEAMEEVMVIGKETTRNVKEVSLFITSLHNEVEVLRKEVEVFRTGTL